MGGDFGRAVAERDGGRIAKLVLVVVGASVALGGGIVWLLLG